MEARCTSVDVGALRLVARVADIEGGVVVREPRFHGA